MTGDDAGDMDEVDQLLGGEEEMGLPADAAFDILHGSREEILDELDEIREEYDIYQLDYQVTHGRGGAKSYEKETKRELFVAYGPADG